MSDHTTPDPIRAALERLTIMAANELDTPGLWAHSRANWDDAIAAARAALAVAPDGEPSDEEVEVWADQQGFIRGHGDHPCGFWIDDGDAGAFARAVLARWGHQSAPPTEGEVGELVAWLGVVSQEFRLAELDPEADQTDRAAALLAQLEVAPVPVSERLPGPEDCDEQGRCWLLTVEDEYPQWRLHSIEGNQPGGSTMIWVPVDSSSGVMVDSFYASHWLPAHALPLPAVEVE